MTRRRRHALVLLLLALLNMVVPVWHSGGPVHADGFNNRSMTLGTSRTGDTGEYLFQFDFTTVNPLGSLRFEFCVENPLPFDPCTPPPGFDISNAALLSQTGETGFVVNIIETTPNELVLSRGSGPLSTPQTSSYQLDPVDNPNVAGSYFIRLYSYGTLDGTGPTYEDSGIAFAIVDGFDVTAFVPPFLEFCVAVSVPNANCLTANGSFIDFGTLSENNVRSGSSQMASATNGVGGVAISVIGTTMTSGVHIIPELSTRSPSSVGTSQFGFNLRDNSSPNVGFNPVGSGTITPTSDYNVPNQFTFRDGDTIAVSGLTTNFSRLTASYIVNVDSDQEPGVYTTTLTYVATATF